MEIIKPFSFISPEESQIITERMKREKEEAIKLLNGSIGNNIDITIKTVNVPAIINPPSKKDTFKNVCKKAFKFVKDNVSFNISGKPFNTRIGDYGFIINPDKINKMIHGKVGVGPIELDINELVDKLY